jgi:hypothetical protein
VRLTWKKHLNEKQSKFTQIKIQHHKLLMPSRKLTQRWHVFQIQINVVCMIRSAVNKHSNKENSVLEEPHKEETMEVMTLFHRKIFSIISSMAKRSHVVIVQVQDTDNDNKNHKKRSIQEDYWDSSHLCWSWFSLACLCSCWATLAVQLKVLLCTNTNSHKLTLSQRDYPHIGWIRFTMWVHTQ